MRVVLLVLLFGALLIILIWGFQRRLIYLPSPASVPPATRCSTARES
jgi:uncharacterized protein